MSYYRAYALRIASDVALPLPESERHGGDPDLVIQRRPLNRKEVLDAMSKDSLPDQPIQFYEGTSEALVTGHIYEEVCFIVEAGRAIYYDVKKDLPDGVLQTYLLGPLMSILLRQRGYLVLHACGLERAGQGIAFLGESGWGKSTLAEYFCRQGYTLLNDDVMAVDLSEGQPPRVVPGYPQIRLREEAGYHLREDFTALPRVNEATTKRVSHPMKFSEAPVPLVRVFMLSPRFGTANALEPISARVATVRLIGHTRATNILTAETVTARHLQQCARLAREVPARQLHRVKDLGRLGEIQRLVEEDLARHPIPNA